MTRDTQITHPSRWIRDRYLEKKEKSAAYSMRAFARDLGMSHSLLSMIMSGERPLTLNQAQKIAVSLNLSTHEEKKLMHLALVSLPDNAKLGKKVRDDARKRMGNGQSFTTLDSEKFQLIAKWYHFPILDLTFTKDFRSNVSWIAKRMGISAVEARGAVNRLLDLGLLEKKLGKLRKTQKNIQIESQKSKLAGRIYNEQVMDRAKLEMKNTDQDAFMKRSITGLSIAIDEKSVEEAKEALSRFKSEFIQRFATEKATEVYQFNLQFFPITQPTHKEDRS